MTEQASLLGLPRELRLQIYEHVFALELDHTIVHNSLPAPTRLEGAPAKQAFFVPWVNLMLACRSTANELRALMKEPSFLNNNSNRTYILDLDATHGGMALGRTVWRRLPCTPDQVQCLEAHYNASRGFHAVGDGGFQPIMKTLFQTLNYFIHCGPRLLESKNRRLSDPIHLKELHIMVESKEWDQEAENPWELSKNDTDPDTVALSLGSFVGMVNNTGVLKGYVDRVQLRSSGQTLNWDTSEAEGHSIPEHWRGYGYEWGVPLDER